MIAFQVRAPHQYGLVDIPVPEITADEVLVKVGGCGICRSDVDVLEGVRPEYCTRYPCILGHEFSGQIVEVGSALLGYKEGDKVAVDSIVRCTTCPNCRKGWTGHCRNGYEQIGFTRPGGMGEFVAVPQRLLYKLSDDIDLADGALIEPLSCAAHGVLKAEIQPGESVVIIGGGTIGAGALQVARLFSPLNVILVEIDERKLEAGEKLGATHRINGAREDIARSVRAITHGLGVDAVIDCSGKVEAVQQCFSYVGTKSRIVMVGIPEKSEFEINFFAMMQNDSVFRASNGYTTRVWLWVMQLLANQYFDTKRIVTHRFRLAEIDKAFEVLRGERVRDQGHDLSIARERRLRTRSRDEITSSEDF